MKHEKKNVKVFTKIFAYTMLLLVLMSLAAVGLFARQFLSFYRAEQQRQLATIFQPMIAAIADRDKTPAEIAEIARTFASSNQSFKFIIRGSDGEVLFSTPGTTDTHLSGDTFSDGLQARFTMITKNQEDTKRTYIFTGYSSETRTIDYGDLIGRSLLALVLMGIIALFGAMLFAKKVTKPLEDELIRERIMEENQRLFFSAASHELKTPIASARALVEGMIANIGDYKDHQTYLRECLKTFDAQTRLVSEILEIVKLSDERTEPIPISLNLTEIGTALVAEYQPIAERQRITILAELPNISVCTDQHLLHRALSNVISNAVQNTPEHGTIQISTELQKNRCIRLHILNKGAQIPKDVLSRLFEPFYQLDPARNSARSGMGLTIVKKSLDRMKIPFGLENTPEGVLFWMDLPCEK